MYKRFFHMTAIGGAPGDLVCWLTSSFRLDKKYKEPTVFTAFYHRLFASYPQAFAQSMKIKQQQLERLAELLLTSYRAKELMVTKATDGEIEARIVRAISQNFAEEEAIEEEARKMLASYAQAARDMDPYKMFLLAKQKLAAKKGFIL